MKISTTINISIFKYLKETFIYPLSYSFKFIASSSILVRYSNSTKQILKADAVVFNKGNIVLDVCIKYL